MGFAPGQLVCCVDDAPHGWTRYGGVSDRDLDGLTKGTVYTVRDVFDDPPGGVGPRASVRLEEIIRRPDYRYPHLEPGFAACRFRPLDESRLTVFRQMLVTPPSKELVDEDLDARIADCERAVREALGF